MMDRVRLPSNYKDLTTQELLDWKLKIENEMDHIKSRLDQARSEAAVNGVYADPGWYRRAEASKRILGRQSQQIQLEIRRRKVAGAQSDERLFIDAAKRRLDEDVYEAIWDEVREVRALAADAEKESAGNGQHC
jgi:hypothetical protein